MPNPTKILYKIDLLLLKEEGKMTEREVKIKLLEYDIKSLKKLLRFAKYFNIPFLIIMNIIAIIRLERSFEFCIIYTYMMLFINYLFMYKMIICISKNETNLVYLKSGLNLIKS